MLPLTGEPYIEFRDQCSLRWEAQLTAPEFVIMSSMSSGSVTTQRSMRDHAWLPELDNLGLACVMLGLGSIGGTTELATTAFVPRLALYALLFAIGSFGLVRRIRRARRMRA